MLLSAIALHLNLPFTGSDVELDSMNELALSSPSQLAFAVHKKYFAELESSKAKAFLIPHDLIAHLPQNSSYILCDDVSLSMAYTTKLFHKKPIEPELPRPVIGKNSIVDALARVENGAVVGDDVIIMAGAYIGTNVRIGDDTIIYPNVTIYRDCVIGNECIIHSGTVIGADGFGFSHTKSGEHIKIYQNGNVIIEDCVEIGANCAIDRAVFNATIIRH
ncbi:MAG: LpxD N-terminal domain-containing protein, partial [Sulfurimonas sp.]